MVEGCRSVRVGSTTASLLRTTATGYWRGERIPCLRHDKRRHTQKTGNGLRKKRKRTHTGYSTYSYSHSLALFSSHTKPHLTNPLRHEHQPCYPSPP
jgi:hypothetical protein